MVSKALFLMASLSTHQHAYNGFASVFETTTKQYLFGVLAIGAVGFMLMAEDFFKKD